jgi:hypothetical protein
MEKTNAILLLHVLNKIAQFESEVFEKCEDMARVTLNKICADNQIAMSYSQLMNIQAGSLMPCSGDAEIDKLVAKIKANALAGIIRVIRQLNVLTKSQRTNSHVPTTWENSPFSPIVNHIATDLVRALFSAIKTPSFFSETEGSNTFKELIVQSVRLLAKIVGQKEFFTLFAEHKVDILVHICLALMQTTQDEYDRIKDKPSDFVSQSIDTVEHQEASDIKPSAVKLLEAVSEHTDGSLTFVVCFVCEVLAFAVERGKRGDVPTLLEEFPTVVS